MGHWETTWGRFFASKYRGVVYFEGRNPATSKGVFQAIDACAKLQ